MRLLLLVLAFALFAPQGMAKVQPPMQLQQLEVIELDNGYINVSWRLYAPAPVDGLTMNIIVADNAKLIGLNTVTVVTNTDGYFDFITTLESLDEQSVVVTFALEYSVNNTVLNLHLYQVVSVRSESVIPRSEDDAGESDYNAQESYR
ncbi:hypothetical protein SIN8267_00431 [Sinobacterium norvegicum]|uniref:Uncharacterized protein n=1 Tax=Sinobacterium norvegicum TaxID=1641715 RepID=A0ABM9ACG6_9GAMM|nr:hypothetical protein [Sinobacterium norvegicum]CAH0990339.1 hypothetical protein SIN8267_00431 [Sinobacterium norvegicum]